ncbi:hypothetical protein U472_08565 [Orenia metallireducens]|jgi:hypothetical protein|uniref:Uncharacterized protein n=1 Tax=Orenia metallireducens TaxID=1413210 RepID=A0A1C0A780_9FIRM|nr:hypothetical protein [Orenia metallireducens]OCL26061.1 hypothetical protein U472_08565 [Orenia metallireducens]
MQQQEIESTALEIFNRIKGSQEQNLDIYIKEAVSKNSNKNEKDKEEEIRMLRKKVKEMMEENKKKEAEIEEMKKIDELEDLKDVNELIYNEYEIASKEEREKVAQKIIFLAESIKDNEFLAKNTLDTFNLYREKMISRCIKEEELGTKVKNLS